MYLCLQYGIDAAIIGSNLGSLSYSKKQELEADAISIKILKDLIK